MSATQVITLLGFYVIKQDEIGVRLTFGQFSGEVRPGLGFAIPFVQQVLKTKQSLQTIDLPEQQIVLSGNISVKISGNLNFRVASPERALLEVSNYRYTIQQLALTTIADVLGTKTIEEVRGEKNQIAQEVENVIIRSASQWGLRDVDIRLTDAQLDPSLLRAMMRETEAQKEANAIMIKAESDKLVSQIFADAARALASSPGAITLRVLQALSDISNEKTTVVIPIPIDLLTNRAAHTTPPHPPEALSGAVPATSATVTPQAMEPIIEASPEPTATTPRYPLGSLRISNDRIIAICPLCQTRYNATEILGKPEYDLDPEHPGQQLRCKKCAALFTLPQQQ